MRRLTHMSSDLPGQGLLDISILLRRWIERAELPDEMAISAITLAEVSADPHEVRGNDEQDVYEEHAGRARRLEILQRAGSEFRPDTVRRRGGPHLWPGDGGGHLRRPQAAQADC
jgi:hypothetical protein